MNNPPAFPYFGHTGWSQSAGMTLRDYFAAKAMQAVLSREDRKGNSTDYAEIAYQMADAMLAAREKT